MSVPGLQNKWKNCFHLSVFLTLPSVSCPKKDSFLYNFEFLNSFGSLLGVGLAPFLSFCVLMFFGFAWKSFVKNKSIGERNDQKKKKRGKKSKPTWHAVSLTFSWNTGFLCVNGFVFLSKFLGQKPFHCLPWDCTKDSMNIHKELSHIFIFEMWIILFGVWIMHMWKRISSFKSDPFYS